MKSGNQTNAAGHRDQSHCNERARGENHLIYKIPVSLKPQSTHGFQWIAHAVFFLLNFQQTAADKHIQGFTFFAKSHKLSRESYCTEWWLETQRSSEVNSGLWYCSKSVWHEGHLASAGNVTKHWQMFMRTSLIGDIKCRRRRDAAMPEEWVELTFVVDAADALLALNVPHPDSLVMRAWQKQRTIHGHRQARH